MSITKGAALALPVVLCLVAAGASVSVSPATGAAPARTAPAVAPAPAAPAFLRAATPRDQPLTGAGANQGTRRLVTLDTALLPGRGRSQSLSLALDATRGVSVLIDRVTQEKAFTSWSGSLVGELGTFSLVEAAGVYRGTVTTNDGLFSISSAGGEHYWLTDVAAFPEPTVDDEMTPAIAASGSTDTAGSSDVGEPSLSSRAGQKGTKKGDKVGKRKRGKAKITVLFGYTKDTLALAGSKPALRAAAALAVSDTNLSFANSGVRAKLRYRGLIKTRGHEKASQFQDFKQLYRLGDGKYDNLLKARNRKHVDLVHLFVAGRDPALCGLGALPPKPRLTNSAYAVSMSALGCLSNLTPTHEIGHNLGADHNDYPGVMFTSRVKYAHGYADPAHAFRTVMSYVDPCLDVGIDCQRIPFYSSTKVTFNGLPVGDKRANNAKVINAVAPKVARYRG